jgi:hypothetical protein
MLTGLALHAGCRFGTYIRVALVRLDHCVGRPPVSLLWDNDLQLKTLQVTAPLCVPA